MTSRLAVLERALPLAARVVAERWREEKAASAGDRGRGSAGLGRFEVVLADRIRLQKSTSGARHSRPRTKSSRITRTV